MLGMRSNTSPVLGVLVTVVLLMLLDDKRLRLRMGAQVAKGVEIPPSTVEVYE